MTQDTAQQLIDRLSGLRGFPDPAKKTIAYNELIRAVMRTELESIAYRAISDWIDAGNTYCPAPGVLAQMILDEQSKLPAGRKRKCNTCLGNYSITVWYAVKRTHNYQIIAKMRLPFTSEIEAHEWQRKPENAAYEVMSFAEPCWDCSPGAVAS